MDIAKTPSELEIEKLELQDAAAALRNDLDTIERRWSEKAVVSSQGNLLFSKAQILAFFRAGLVRMKSFERVVTRVVVDGDTAIATGSDTVVPLAGVDTGKTVFCSYMNCWNRENGEWKLLGRQVSVVGKMRADGSFETSSS
jgi:ketosteroid isomerase-like protein